MATLLEMLRKANQACETNVSYKMFAPLKNAFAKSEQITYEEVVSAVETHPAISKEEVLRLFYRECYADNKTKISGQKIFRTHLISLVEALENWTGREMCNEHNPCGPINDYDGKGVAVEDIAIFFSSGEGKIAEIKAQINKAENN